MRTHYRWQKHLREQGPKGLEDKSRRPKHLRRPTWSMELAQEVLRLREKYPRWRYVSMLTGLREKPVITTWPLGLSSGSWEGIGWGCLYTIRIQVAAMTG
jgi:hypothetical protein